MILGKTALIEGRRLFRVKAAFNKTALEARVNLMREQFLVDSGRVLIYEIFFIA